MTNYPFDSSSQHFDKFLDLNQECIHHPDATFYVRVKGHSMKDVGLEDGDVLIIDRSLEPASGKIAVCYIDGEFTVKTLFVDPQTRELWLVPANDEFKPLLITDDNNFMVWGIVSYVIKKV